MVTTAQQQQRLSEVYSQLSVQHRSIVQVLALLYEPTSRSAALDCWTTAHLGQEGAADFKPLTKQQFNAQVRGLLKQGLLVEPRQGLKCPELLQDIVARDTVNSGTFEPISRAISSLFPVRRRYSTGPRDFRQASTFVRELRLAIYRQNQTEIHSLLADLEQVYWFMDKPNFADVLWRMLTNPFDAEWLFSLTPELQEQGLSLMLNHSVKANVAADEAFDFLEGLYEAEAAVPSLMLLYVEQLWLRGHIKEAAAVLPQIQGGNVARQAAMAGAIAWLQGNPDQALAHYRQGLKVAGKSQTAQAAWFNYPATVLYLLALLQGSRADWVELQNHLLLLEKQPSHWLATGALMLLVVLQIEQGQQNPTQVEVSHEQIDDSGLTALLEVFSYYWMDLKGLERWLPAELSRLYQATARAGYSWVAMEIATLASQFEVADQPDAIYTEIAAVLRTESQSPPLIDVVRRKEAWERSLEALTSLNDDLAVTSDQAVYRLAWRLRFESINNWELTPLEQKRSARGGWTKGKAIALRRLQSASQMPPYLTTQDKAICATLEIEYEADYYYRAPRSSYQFCDRALLALVEHPTVQWAGSGAKVEVVSGEPELIVKRLDQDRLRLELSPALTTDGDVLAWKETPTRLKVVSITEQHQRISQLLGPHNQLEVPAQAQERVLQAISSISTLVTVQSDIGGGIAAEEVPSDPTPHVHLLPAGDGLKVSLLTRPFAEGGSYYPPGKGGETVIAEVDGKRLQTQRDLKVEKRQAKAVKKACPVLSTHKPKGGEWQIEETADCLELLLQLQSLGDQVKLEWPQGEKYKVSRQLGINDFQFNIRRQQDWFAASGEVQVSEGQVLDLRQLLSLLETTPGQFVQLSDGQFLALTDEFRQRLQTLGRLSEASGKGLRINRLAALAMDELTEDMAQLKVDKAWKAHLKKIADARAIEPQVPETLQAELRDYQGTGYTWLSRLANWGVGACLADDMGLGKTLQAIALILSRCDQGPTLVVAPTSVAMNWLSELARFAPSLTAHTFTSDGRQELVDSLGPGDVLACSYGLLQQDDMATMLAKKTWQNIVLDEAQAIKNSATKRSQAAMALQGDFKLLTTGTPIENHLGELWNLFRFINPGLLGSLEQFNQQFANPIERDQDESAKE
ncbi:MAG: SNF2-related protein, partial [Cyanobacteria bacterium P01_A01_bin.105]